MRTLKTSLLSLSMIAALSSAASAQTVGFDEITSGPVSWFSNYGGLAWSNAYAMNGQGYFGSAAAAGGNSTALTSGKYVVGNGGGNALSLSGGLFNLLGGTFAAGWRTGMTLNVVGSYAGTRLYDQSYTIDWNKASTLAFNMHNIDKVVFTTSGGTVDGFNAASNTSFAADNFVFGNSDEESVGARVIVDQSVVPEPMTVSLMAAGLFAVGAAAARRRRTASV